MQSHPSTNPCPKFANTRANPCPNFANARANAFFIIVPRDASAVRI